MKRVTLGQLLLRQGVIDDDQLRSALGHQKRWGGPLGKALIELKFCSEKSIAEALSAQTGLKLYALDDDATLGATQAVLLPLDVARQHRAVPIRVEGKRGEVLVVALAGPASLEQIDGVRIGSGKGRVVAHLAADSQLERAFDRIYGSARGPANPPRPVEAAPTPGALPNEAEFDFGADDRGSNASEVLLFGWAEGAVQALTLLLQGAGFSPRQASALDLATASPKVVVIAPLPSIEAHVEQGEAVGGQLVVAVKSPETDLERARKVGAKGLVPAPIDPDLLIRAIRRCAEGAGGS